jgi:AhpD family alkylhydroperoxidase
MTRIPMIDPAAASGRTRSLLEGVVAKRGRVSDMMRVMANSPAALEGYLGFGTALGGGVLHAALRERIAIAVAEANACGVCLVDAAHTHFGRDEGLTDIELSSARGAESGDPSAAAALRFALAVMWAIGHVSDVALDEVRAAGFGDAAIMEITAVVFMNVFTNAVNDIAETIPDYPAVCAR